MANRQNTNLRLRRDFIALPQQRVRLETWRAEETVIHAVREQSMKPGVACVIE